MTWAAAKSSLATKLAQVAITAPIALTIAKAYEDPPAQYQDLPCFVIFPPPVEIERGMGLRIKDYTVPVLCLVLEANLERGAALADAFREALIDHIDINVTLEGNAVQAFVMRVEAAAGFERGGRTYTGFRAHIRVEIKEPFAFVGDTP